MQLNLFNVTTEKKNCYPANLVVGFDLYVNNSDANIEAYIPHDDYNDAVTSGLSGYTFYSSNTSGINIHNIAETLVTLPIIGTISVSDIPSHPLFGSQLFARELKNGIKTIGIDRILVYNRVQTGSALQHALDYINA